MSSKCNVSISHKGPFTCVYMFGVLACMCSFMFCMSVQAWGLLIHSPHYMYWDRVSCWSWSLPSWLEWMDSQPVLENPFPPLSPVCWDYSCLAHPVLMWALGLNCSLHIQQQMFYPLNKGSSTWSLCLEPITIWSDIWAQTLLSVGGCWAIL